MLKFTEDVKGHDFIQNQICQALKKDRLPHAILFSGPTGVGKKKLAWALAKALLCEAYPSEESSLFVWNKDQDLKPTDSGKDSIEDSGKETQINLAEGSDSQRAFQKASSMDFQNSFQPCETCLSCRSVTKKESPDILEIQTETLQIKLKDLELILPFLSLQSFARAKIVFIDSAEKLNSQASNFLLKTIEEPPPKTFFFLISSQMSQISLTIRSRVQNIGFNPLSESLTAQLSREDTEKWMIKSSRGQMDVLEELRGKKDLRRDSFELFFDCIKKELSEADLSKTLKDRKTALNVLKFWRLFLRDLRLLPLSEEMINKDYLERMREIRSSSKTDLDFLIKKTLEMEYELRANNVDIKLSFESFIISMKEILFCS